MFKKGIWVLAIWWMTAGLASGDQAAWIQEDLAHQAKARITTGSQIRRYCAPCGDKVWQTVKVENVEVKPVSDDFHQLFVNGQGLDLAYTYVSTGGKWRNLAMQLGLTVFDVPAILPQVSKRPDQDENSHPLDEFVGDCIAQDTSPANVSNCLFVAYEKWDAELNRIYNALKTTLSDEQKTALKNSQLKWLQYRDLEFAFIDRLYPEKKRANATLRAKDRLQIVRDRVLELRGYSHPD